MNSPITPHGGGAHTAGPWSVVVEGPTANPNTGSWAVESEASHIASYCTLADAHLISAAPDLLTALINIADFLDAVADEQDAPDDSLLGQARVAIAKATP